MEESPKRGLFGTPDWRLLQLKESPGLEAFERTLFDGIFANAEGDDDDPPGGTEGPVATRAGLAHVRLSKLRTHFATKLKEVEDELYDAAIAKRWFAGRPDKVRDRWHRRGFLLMLLGIGLTVGLAAKTHLGLLGIPVLLAGIVLI